MRQNSIIFGNFICRFGDLATLIDYAEEIIIPAFTDRKLSRRYGDTSYFFIDVALENLGTPNDPRLAIAGRFVKDTVLKRQQVYSQDGGLRPDRMTMRSAPSAFFLLFLNNHRLAYFAETADAPDMKAFALTAKNFIVGKHEKYIRDLKEQREKDGQRITLVNLRIEVPLPTLNVVPLTSNASIEAFLSRYRTLKRVQIRLLRPNDEFDAASMIQAVREQNARINAESTLIEHQSSDGLDKKAAVEEITEASRTGNQIVTLNGKDHDGNTLKGNNENFQLGVNLKEKPETREKLIDKIRSVFDAQVRAGAITIGQTARDLTATMRRLASRLLP